MEDPFISLGDGDSGEAVTLPPRNARRRITVAFLGLVVLSLLAAQRFFAASGINHEATSALSAGVNVLGDFQCFKFRSKGLADCIDGCAGADDRCYNKTNKLVAFGITITNMKWPDENVYVPRVWYENQLRVSSDSSGARIHIVQRPDTSLILITGGQRVIAAKYQNVMRLNPLLKRWVIRAFDIFHPRNAARKPAEIMSGSRVQLCRPTVRTDVFVINFITDAGPIPMWIRELSWKIFGHDASSTGPGIGGYWKISPPPTFGIDRCDFKHARRLVA